MVWGLIVVLEFGVLLFGLLRCSVFCFVLFDFMLAGCLVLDFCWLFVLTDCLCLFLVIGWFSVGEVFC